MRRPDDQVESSLTAAREPAEAPEVTSGAEPRLRPGQRRTRQRRLVWEALHELGPHHTADDIIAYIQSRYHVGLPKSTVYRALETMLGTGDATASRLDDAGLRYEIADAPHAHAICTGCGRVFHIDDLALKVAAQELLGMHHFLPLRAELTVRGLCGSCRVDAPARQQGGRLTQGD